MRVFFSKMKEKPIKEEFDVDAIDIITNKYKINIRRSGISILSLATMEESLNQTLDLE